MDSKEVDKRRLALDEYAHTDGNGVEFWYARDIMPVFGYSQWRSFEDAIKRAVVSCETGKTPVQNHFAEVRKMVEIGSGTSREIKDYKLTRYACYLIAQNGDVRKEEIALAASMTAYNAESKDMHGQAAIEKEHVGNNSSVRKTLVERGIVPENLPAAEDTKKVERRVRFDERKLLKDDGFKDNG